MSKFPLHAAVLAGDSAEMQKLLKSSSVEMVHIVDDKGNAPLHLAVEEGHENIVQMLLNHHANPDQQNNQGDTPLHLAARAGHEETVDKLIKFGANKDTKNSQALTAAAVAYLQGHYGIAIELTTEDHTPNILSSKQIELANDANPLLQNNSNEPVLNTLTPDQQIFNAVKCGNEKILYSLLKNKDLDLKSKDEDGNTVFHVIPETNITPKSQRNMAGALVERGYSLSVTNNFQETGIHALIRKGYKDIVWPRLEKSTDRAKTLQAKLLKCSEIESELKQALSADPQANPYFKISPPQEFIKELSTNLKNKSQQLQTIPIKKDRQSMVEAGKALKRHIATNPATTPPPNKKQAHSLGLS